MKKRIIFVRTPSGKVSILKKSRKHSYHKCSVSGKVLNKKKYTSKEFRNLNKSKRVVSRPFGDRLPEYSREEIFRRDVLNRKF